MAESVYRGAERRRSPRVQLTGAALLASRRDPGRAFTAVLDNVNRMGAGFQAKEALDAGEGVTVSLAFVSPQDEDEKETLTGRVAWVKPWERGFLMGVVWDRTVSQGKNPRLASYLDDTLRDAS
jgi:hypothetical protein